MKNVVVATTITLLLLAAVPLAAQERNIQVGVFVSQVEMQGENDFGDGFVTDFDEGDGFGASANFYFGRYLSVEAGVFNIRTESTLIFEDSATFDLGTLELTPVTLGAQFHLLGPRRIDPYIGAGVAYVVGDHFLTPDTENAGLGRIELENGVGYMINAGIAVQITNGLGIVVDGRQIQYEPSSRSSVTGVEQDLEITPRILSAGLRLRF